MKKEEIMPHLLHQMEAGRHVLLVGPGAEDLLREINGSHGNGSPVINLPLLISEHSMTGRTMEVMEQFILNHPRLFFSHLERVADGRSDLFMWLLMLVDHRGRVRVRNHRRDKDGRLEAHREIVPLHGGKTQVIAATEDRGVLEAIASGALINRFSMIFHIKKEGDTGQE